MALRDVREQLFDAADRILLRSGPAALTSRSLTAEAGCAKGVLHRHFTDFDGFLAEYVLDRAHRLDTFLMDTVGTGTVAGNVVDAVTAVFTSVAVAIIPLITFRDELRSRLRHQWPAGVPVITEAAEMIAAYLAAEQDRGRVPAGTDVQTVAAIVIGTTHLLYADRTGTPPTRETLERAVSAIV